MQKNYNFFIGIDVSKPYFDACLSGAGTWAPLTQRFPNTPKGLQAFGKWIQGQGVNTSQALVVAENTGLYHRRLWQYCSEAGLNLHIGNATHIKHSFGIARGKSDRVDAERLCRYAARNWEDLTDTAPYDAALIQLKDLLRVRSRLIKQRMSTRGFLRELKATTDKAEHAAVERLHAPLLQELDRSLKRAEEAIRTCLKKQSGALRENYRLLCSIPGIGHVTALSLISATHNFRGGACGKRLASYCGVAPFEHTSGISVRGRSRVHHMANKEIKCLLHLCALTAIQHCRDLEGYYQRKVGDGKNKMTVINAVKAKLLLRVAAVIKKQTPYENKPRQAA